MTQRHDLGRPSRHSARTMETVVVSVIGAIIVIFAANLLLGRDRSHGTV